MDKYLVTDSAYTRLWAEYQKYGSLIVAVDFDDTLYDFHGTGESYEMVRQLVRDLHKIGCIITIWTGNKDIDFVKDFLSQNNINWNYINEDAPFAPQGSRKLYANVYIDDRAGLEQVYNDLTRIVKNVTSNN
jgi:hypothetical protein